MKKVLLSIVKAIAFFGAWLGIYLLLNMFPAIASPSFISGNAALERLWWEALPCFSVIIVTLFFVFVVERGKLHVALAYDSGRDIQLGILLGILWIGIVVGAMYMCGLLKITGPDSVKNIGIWFAAALVNVVMQEYLVRGYLFSLFKNNLGRAWAVILTTLLFTGMHYGMFDQGTIAILNVVTTGLFLGLLVLYTGGLLAPILAHYIWNAAGCLVMGGVALADDYPSIFECSVSGMKLLTGGKLKFEGSAITLAVNVLLICGMLIAVAKKKRVVDRFKK